MIVKELPLHSGMCNRLFILAHHCTKAINEGYKLYINPNDYNFNKLLSYIIESNDIFYKGEKGDFEIIPTNCQYWQSESFFDVSLIRNIFKFPQYIIDDIIEKYGDLSDTVAIHVRRGDYIWLNSLKTYYIPDRKYYLNAYNDFFKGKNVIIISDDKKYCERILKVDGNAKISEYNDDVYDLCLLSLCKHHICSNSTFSWWGCWLNEKEDAINLYPNKWFRCKTYVDEETLLPDRWIKYDYFD